MLHERSSLSVPSDGLRVVVVADTHGHPHERAAGHIAEQKPRFILHGGDIGDLAVLDALANIAPVLAVRGNIDSDGEHAPDARTLSFADEEGILAVVLLTHIAVLGPKLRADARRLAEREGASIVVCGHSHVPLIARDRGIVVFNPGSIGPRRFTLPIVFGVMEIARAGVTMHHVDAERGVRWRPCQRARPT